MTESVFPVQPAPTEPDPDPRGVEMDVYAAVSDPLVICIGDEHSEQAVSRVVDSGSPPTPTPSERTEGTTEPSHQRDAIPWVDCAAAMFGRLYSLS